MVSVGLDLGYGFAKIVSGATKLLFPSVVGDATDRSLEGAFGARRVGYDVRVNGRRYFVGELALRQSWNASRALELDRTSNPAVGVILALSLALFGEEPVALGYGLPLDVYRQQRRAVEAWLGAFGAQVEAPELFPGRRQVRVGRAKVFAQGVAALTWEMTTEAAELIGRPGYVALLDAGYKTSDLVTLDGQAMTPVAEASGSVSMGGWNVDALVVRALRERYGIMVRQEMLEPLLVSEEETMVLGGRPVPLAALRAEARETVAQSVANWVSELLGDRLALVHRIFLAGGAATVVEPGLRRLGVPTALVPDSQFANARGYLLLLDRDMERVAG